jgi:MYXO-CTERM domain-containing protein
LSKSAPFRSLFAALLSLCVLLLAGSAFAAGRVEWKSKSFKERSDKSWMLELKIFLPRAPDVAYVPMKFEFEPQVYFERALVDGQEGPIERKVPLEGRQPLIETVDVGFLDNGTSKIESRTKFSFKVKRDLGYDAGEYKVTIKDTRNGQTVGTATNITFDGQNEIIDRRAMVFTGEKKKEKKKEEAKEGEEKKSDEAKSEEKSDEGDSSDKSEEGSEEESDNSGGDEPPAVEGKPGGCGCRVPGHTADSGLWGSAFGLGLLLVLARRRRR